VFRKQQSEADGRAKFERFRVLAARNLYGGAKAILGFREICRLLHQ
jgi:hypothetical protein